MERYGQGALERQMRMWVILFLFAIVVIALGLGFGGNVIYNLAKAHFQ